MAKRPLSNVVRHLRRIALLQECERLKDEQLLEGFVVHRDEGAFAALVKRHGPMILGICRRVLSNHHDAEDALQATFLVLVRKAASIRKRELLANWLYGVAYRTALQARKVSARRTAKERQVGEMARNQATEDDAMRELLPVLDQELSRLPDMFRVAIILCDLEGKTRKEAARQVRIPEATLSTRLARARAMLAKRLARHGKSLSSGALVVGITQDTASASVPSSLVISIVKAAALYAAGNKVTAGAISAEVAALTEGVVKAMLLSKLKHGAVLVLTLTLLASGGGLAARHAREVMSEESGPLAATNQQPAEKLQPNPAKEKQPPTDLYGDPLPDGAISRLGTVRLRHSESVNWLQFTPDGKSLVSQSRDGVAIWQADTGKQIHFFPFDKRAGLPDEGASISRDGKLLAMSGKSGAYIHDIATGKHVQTIGTSEVGLTQLSPDGKILAVQNATQPWPFELWDIASGKMLHSGGADGSNFRILLFSPDGKTLVTAGFIVLKTPPQPDNKISFFDAATGKKLRELPLGTAIPYKLALSPDGKHLAFLCFGEDWQMTNRIHVWDIAAAKEIRQLVPAVKNHSEPRYEMAIAFAPDGRTLYAAGGAAHTLTIWNPFTGKELLHVGTEFGHCSVLAVAADNKTVASADMGAIRILDAARGKDLVTQVGHKMWVLHTPVTPNGGIVATADGYRLVVWNAKSGRSQYQMEVKKGTSIRFADFIDGGRNLVTFEVDEARKTQVLRVRELATGKELRHTDLQQKEAVVSATPLAIAPDGKTLAMIAYANPSAIGPGGKPWAIHGPERPPVNVVDCISGTPLRTLGNLETGAVISGAAFTAGGRTLVAWCSDFQVRLWNVDNGLLLRKFPFTLEAVRNGPFPVPAPAMAMPAPPFADQVFCDIRGTVSPDGRLVALGRENDFVITIYDLATGKLVRTVDTLTDCRWPATFSPDSRSLACGSEIVYVVEVATGRVRHSFAGHFGRSMSLAFSADGKTLVSGGFDTTALVWDLAGRHSAKTPLAKKLSGPELDALWAELASADAARGFQATRRLAAAPADAVPYLGVRLSPVKAVEEKRLTRLVADLDDDQFPVRQAAAKELEKLGETATGTLEKALAGKPSLELTRRIQGVLENHAKMWQHPGPNNLRMLRALETLELAATPKARQVLERLAGGAAGARITQDAAAALERLASLDRLN
jgi:RNA polymerase sigma factor (sigma-70 family)